MPRRLICAALTAVCALVALQALPIDRAYALRFAAAHQPRALLGLALAGILALGLFSLALKRWPLAAGTGIAATTLVLAATSGNLLSAVAAGAILAAACLLGDLLFFLLSRSAAKWGDLPIVFAAGLAAVGVLLLLLGEAGLLHRAEVLALGGALFVLRVGRIRDAVSSLSRCLRAGIRPLRWHEAFWLAIVVAVLLSSFVSTLGPEVTYDALAYHLPEARDTAERGRVEPLPDVLPQTLFWRNYQTFLSLGFLFQGERVVRLLHFAAGISVLGAALALLERLRARGGPLVLLGLLAMPMAVLQLHSIWADWPTALFVTAAAAQIAGGTSAGRLGLAGLLFGAAIATKIFALLALPALLLLWWRRHETARLRGLGAAIGGTLLVLLPWMAWSQTRAGFWLAPYSWSVTVHRTAGGEAERPGEKGEPIEKPRRPDAPTPLHFLRLPYDLTFRTNLFEGSALGYNGLLPLVLLAGVFGWGARRLGLFLVVAVAAILPWYLLYEPGARYLLPVYPLYVVFAAAGMDRMTDHFAGTGGAVAGFALGVLTLAFPGQFLSLPFDARVALGKVSREQALATYLPSYPLWRLLGQKDHVLFAGEWDRYHCPAERAWRTGWFPIAQWGRDPERWRRGFVELRIRYCAVNSEWGGSSQLPLPPGALELVGERGAASLYRVRPETLGSSDPPGVPAGPPRAER